MAKFFDSRDYQLFTFMAKVLGFSNDKSYIHSSIQRQFDKEHFQLFINADNSFRLYKDGKSILTGTWPEDMNALTEASKEDMFEDMESWLLSRATTAATYRRLADKRMEEARMEHSCMSNLEIAVGRTLHDLKKTARIVEEGHQ